MSLRQTSLQIIHMRKLVDLFKWNTLMVDMVFRRITAMKVTIMVVDLEKLQSLREQLLRAIPMEDRVDQLSIVMEVTV